MADYFTSDHFKLLNRWKGQKRDESNRSRTAYADLKNAYEVTEAWARKVRGNSSPLVAWRSRKRPTNQGNNFAGTTGPRSIHLPRHRESWSHRRNRRRGRFRRED